MVEVHSLPQQEPTHHFFFFFCTLVTGPRRSLSLKLSDSRVCKSHLRARLPITRGAAPARKMVMGVLPVPPHVTFPTLRTHARGQFLQWYLAHKKRPPHRTLQWSYA